MTENDSDSQNDLASSDQESAGQSEHQDVDSDQSAAPTTNARLLKLGPQGRAKVMRFAVLGTELSGSALVGAAIGYMIDSVRGHEKAYATAFATLVGFTLGMIRFIREVKKASN